MKLISRILCVVLIIAVAVSAASCSLDKQYAYQKSDAELPIGVYVYNLYNAYSQAQQYAQQSDKYDSATGRYDGKKSFLKMEIKDSDGKTAIAEDWIKDKAKESTIDAIAVLAKYNELGCTMDQMTPSNTYGDLVPYASMYGYDTSMKLADMAAPYEEYGIGFDSWLFCQQLNDRENAVFAAEYGEGGPSAVSTEELTKYFKENYTSYKYISVPLFETVQTTPDDGTSDTTSTNKALSDKAISDYKKEFDGYASTLSKGGSFEDAAKSYMKAHDIENDPTQSNVTVIDKDTQDELSKAILDMKDGQAMTIEIGESDDSKTLYLLYREPIENQVKDYTEPGEHRLSVLSSMKHEDFHELLESYAKDKNFELSSACNSYNPSMFEKK